MKYIRGEEGGAGVPSQEAAEAGAAASDAASTATMAYARMREQLASLTLSNDAVWERENSREQVRAPWVIKGPYLVLCLLLDTLFDGRPIARFWFLETVARMPYFSYISCLHLYESLGWWRLGIQVKRVHFAEEFNEAHHLLTMEALGGDARWRDRFLAYHSAIVYYWLLVLAWVVSPTLAYNFSELIEAHAVDTYEQFLEENEDTLRELPAPPISKYYWENETCVRQRARAGARALRWRTRACACARGKDTDAREPPPRSRTASCSTSSRRVLPLARAGRPLTTCTTCFQTLPSTRPRTFPRWRTARTATSWRAPRTMRPWSPPVC